MPPSADINLLTIRTLLPTVPTIVIGSVYVCRTVCICVNNLFVNTRARTYTYAHAICVRKITKKQLSELSCT